MQEENRTTITTRIDDMARDALAALGAIDDVHTKFRSGREGQGQFGKFSINYGKGVALEYGVTVDAYAGIDIKYNGKTVYSHHGNTIKHTPGKWQEELAALPQTIKAENIRPTATSAAARKPAPLPRHLPRGYL
jgi:hypothetical protein